MFVRYKRSLLTNYTTNLVRLIANNRLLRPLVVAYCVTTHCNLNCVYCEDFGARRNAEQPTSLSISDAKHLLAIIRTATDHLLITGGEPLLYPQLLPLLRHARKALRYRHLTLLSNASLLNEHKDILPLIDRLMVSMDAVTTEIWDQTLGGVAGMAQMIKDNLIAAAKRQHIDDFRIVVNCVVTPETLPHARAVLAFCMNNGIFFSFSPQSVNNWPRYELLVSETYRDFVDYLIDQKLQGAPILGSLSYLRMIKDFEPYACYPLLAPRVFSDGTLVYPCRPIEREGDAHGGRTINLLAFESWQSAVDQAVLDYSSPPSTCGSCFQQCYIEPSLMQSRPWALLRELIRFRPSRQGEIVTYAPG